MTKDQNDYNYKMKLKRHNNLLETVTFVVVVISGIVIVSPNCKNS